jgi:hypothetical protein
MTLAPAASARAAVSSEQLSATTVIENRSFGIVDRFQVQNRGGDPRFLVVRGRRSVTAGPGAP